MFSEVELPAFEMGAQLVTIAARAKANTVYIISNFIFKFSDNSQIIKNQNKKCKINQLPNLANVSPKLIGSMVLEFHIG